MDARLAFSIDLDRCIGCRACAVACSAGNELSPATGAHVTVTEVVRREGAGLWGSFAHHRCFHCARAPCVEVCPTGTLSKRDGLTAVAAERCSGCGYCVDACPFAVPRLREGGVAKCVGCLEPAEQGAAPWCARTCPSEAIRFGPREAVLAEARRRVERLLPRHPRAQVYGEAQLGGLGLLLVLLEAPEVYGLPADPRPSRAVAAWQEVVKPGALGLAAAAAVTMGVTFLAARRQRAKDEAAHAGADGAAAPERPRDPAPGGGQGDPHG